MPLEVSFTISAVLLLSESSAYLPGLGRDILTPQAPNLSLFQGQDFCATSLHHLATLLPLLTTFNHSLAIEMLILLPDLPYIYSWPFRRPSSPLPIPPHSLGGRALAFLLRTPSPNLRHLSCSNLLFFLFCLGTRSTDRASMGPYAQPAGRLMHFSLPGPVLVGLFLMLNSYFYAGAVINTRRTQLFIFYSCAREAVSLPDL